MKGREPPSVRSRLRFGEGGPLGPLGPFAVGPPDCVGPVRPHHLHHPRTALSVGDYVILFICMGFYFYFCTSMLWMNSRIKLHTAVILNTTFSMNESSTAAPYTQSMSLRRAPTPRGHHQLLKKNCRSIFILIYIYIYIYIYIRAVTIRDMKPKSRHSDPRSCVAVW